MPCGVILRYNLHLSTMFQANSSHWTMLYVALRILQRCWGSGCEASPLRNRSSWWLLWISIVSDSHCLPFLFSGVQIIWFLVSGGKEAPFCWWRLEAAGTDEGLGCSEVYSCLSKAELNKYLEKKERNTLNLGSMELNMSGSEWKVVGQRGEQAN